MNLLQGGFSGRPNKLVDSCYSFWQLSPLLISQMSLTSRAGPIQKALLQLELPVFSAQALAEYILLCCQHYAGGFKDKPGASRDYYHSCYALSGLSLAQNCSFGSSNLSELKNVLVGVSLEPINPLFNVCHKKVERCQHFFSKMKPITASS